VTSNELIERISESWDPFREGIARLGSGRIGERTPVGWTYRDLIAHVVAWEERTARRLRAFRESGRQIGPEGDAALGIGDARDTDGYNAQVCASHRTTAPDALLAELDATHRRLVDEIAQLSDAQMGTDVQPTSWGPQSWVVAIVAGNSFGHYREHAPELGVTA
jgi:uncharacterized protein (TIGR03083 family)